MTASPSPQQPQRKREEFVDLALMRRLFFLVRATGEMMRGSAKARYRNSK
jgi:hypothetical protein